MKVRRLAPAFAAVLLAGIPRLAHADCSPPPDQKIAVNIDAADPVRDTTLSIRQLSQQAPPDKRPERKGYDYALGMTETILDWTISGQILPGSDGRGHACSV